MDQTYQRRVQAMTSMSAAENMRSYAQASMQHAQDVQKLVPAFEALYATMTDSQKRAADQVFRDVASQPGRAGRG